MADPTIDFDALMAQRTPAATQSPTIDFDALMAKGATPEVGSKRSGYVANIGAGLNEAIADTAGLPVDIATGAINMGSRGVTAAGNYLLGTSGTAPQIANPVGGSASIKRAMGYAGIDPDETTATTPGEQVARGIGQGVGSMVVPGLGAEAALGTEAASALGPVSRGILTALRGGGEQPAAVAGSALNAGKNIAIGAASGAGQAVAEQAAPEGYKPLWGAAGALLGASTPIAGEAAFRWAMAHPSVESEAASSILKGATSPDTLRTAVNNPGENLPGVVSTPGKISNDAGVLQMENWARTQKPERFTTAEAGDNQARTQALASVAPAEGLSPGQMVTQHLDRLDAAQKAIEDAAQARAQETLGAIGTPREPEDIGAAARGQITGNYTGPLATADAGARAAEANLAGTLDRMGGSQAAGDFDTANQAYGSQLRQFVQEGKEARDAGEGRIWAIAQQNGPLQFDHTPTQQAVSEARGMINPAGGDRLTPAETALYDTIDQWQAPQDFDTIKAMRTNIGDAANMAFRGGDTRAGRRLLTVRSGLDASIENAVDTSAARESAAVKAGTLDPNQTMAANLAADVASWRANRGQRPAAAVGNARQGNAGPAPEREASVPGAPGTEGAAGEGRPAAANGPELAGTPSEVGSPSDRYAQARAYTRESHRIFDDTPAGTVIARGPYGAPDKLPDSLVARQFLNGKATEPEAIRNFEEATGGRSEAVVALQDAAMFDLRRTAVNDATGRINPTAFARWTAAHDGLLSVYPELRAKIGDVASAQRLVDGAIADRDALTDRYRQALGESDATVMSRYFRRGDGGADAMNAYARETGNTASARDAMADHIANDLRNRAARDGVLNVPVYRNWLAANRGALSRRPDLLARYDTAAGAQEALAQAQADRADAVKQFQTGAARFWLGTDPNTAVTNALSLRAGNNPVKNIRDIMAMAKGDAAAQDGIKHALRDWLVNKGVSGKEAGTTGTNWMKGQVMQDLINKNRTALAVAFSPDEMKTLDLLASSLKEADRSISGSKPPIGPGTARDIAAVGRYGGRGQTLLRVLGRGTFKLATMAAGAHLGGIEGLIGGTVGADALRDLGGAKSVARQEAVKSLMVEALADPQAMRVLLAHATPDNMDTLAANLARRLAQTTMAASQRYMH